VSAPDAPEFDEARIVRALDHHEVAYVLVGGLGARLHGASRPTMDFDLCAAWDLANLGRLVKALEELDAQLRVRPGVRPPTIDAQLLQDSVVTTWRTAAGDVDVLVGIPSSPQAGLSRFESLRSRAEVHVVAGCTVYVAALTDIIASKRVANRPADQEVLPELEALASQPQRPPAPVRWQPPGPHPEPPEASTPGQVPER
jgi:hypothetical protein